MPAGRTRCQQDTGFKGRHWPRGHDEPIVIPIGQRGTGTGQPLPAPKKQRGVQDLPIELFLAPQPGDNSALRCCLTFCVLCFLSGSWNGDVTPGAEALDKQGFTFGAGPTPAEPCPDATGMSRFGHCPCGVPPSPSPGMQELLSILYTSNQGRGVPMGLTSPASLGFWDEPNLGLHQGCKPCRRTK